jgi:hypothetical protein
VIDDKYYLKPQDGEFVFSLPVNKFEDDIKFEIIIGPGKIDDLTLHVKFNS